jgi:hypothetical protein
VKREDAISPVYGGNKVRRYEYVLADVKARGARRVVTAGGYGSTQVMATARFCQHLGIGCTAVLFDQPVTRFVQRAMRVDVTAGAELVYGGSYLRTALETVRARYASSDNYLILPGAAEPLATLGYLDAVLELAAQVESGAMPRPDVMVLPTGSSGTLAALALGCAWLGWGHRGGGRSHCDPVGVQPGDGGSARARDGALGGPARRAFSPRFAPPRALEPVGATRSVRGTAFRRPTRPRRCPCTRAGRATRAR